jgi:hypothetical protein
LAISAATRVAALKKVDFPVFGLPITPNNREYDRWDILLVHLIYCLIVLGYIICACRKRLVMVFFCLVDALVSVNAE